MAKVLEFHFANEQIKIHFLYVKNNTFSKILLDVYSHNRQNQNRTSINNSLVFNENGSMSHMQYTYQLYRTTLRLILDKRKRTSITNIN